MVTDLKETARALKAEQELLEAHLRREENALVQCNAMAAALSELDPTSGCAVHLARLEALDSASAERWRSREQQAATTLAALAAIAARRLQLRTRLNAISPGLDVAPLPQLSPYPSPRASLPSARAANALGEAEPSNAAQEASPARSVERRAAAAAPLLRLFDRVMASPIVNAAAGFALAVALYRSTRGAEGDVMPRRRRARAVSVPDSQAGGPSEQVEAELEEEEVEEELEEEKETGESEAAPVSAQSPRPLSAEDLHRLGYRRAHVSVAHTIFSS